MGKKNSSLAGNKANHSLRQELLAQASGSKRVDLSTGDYVYGEDPCVHGGSESTLPPGTLIEFVETPEEGTLFPPKYKIKAD